MPNQVFGRMNYDVFREVLEVNTIPGMTDTSLLPKAAEVAGIGFDRVVQDMLDLAALDT